MSITNKIVEAFFYTRNKEIDHFRKEPHSVAWAQFQALIHILHQTEYGERYGAEKNITYEQFSERIPVVSYEDIAPEIDNALSGGKYSMWNASPRWYAKSSGTTNSVSKFIPTTEESLHQSHYRGLKDVAAVYTSLYPDGNAFDGKTLTLGGSLSQHSCGAMIGDLSGILMTNCPPITYLKRSPSREVSLLDNFEEKIEQIVRCSHSENITTFAGVPSWYMVLMNKILEYTGKDNMCEVWHNIDFFAHGGMSFMPYREQYEKLFPSPSMKYMETYNASEGFFALQDDTTRDDMLLMLDYHTFYEFLELCHLDTPEKAIPLEQVRCGVNYAMIISTSGGLWRYMIGDTVKFTSTSPYKIKVTGRTKHFINIVGEEVIIDNTDKAIKEACEKSGAIIEEYTVAPIFMKGKERGAHEWVVEFSKSPDSLELFTDTVDKTLQQLNSDYCKKREGNGALNRPKIHVAPSGTFYRWMKERGKLGGQNKIPRLSNNRDYIEPLLKLIDK